MIEDNKFYRLEAVVGGFRENDYTAGYYVSKKLAHKAKRKLMWRDWELKRYQGYEDCELPALYQIEEIEVAMHEEF